MSVHRIALMAASLFLSAAPTLAQQPPGDASQGRLSAQGFCGACHATSTKQDVSPNPKATPFIRVAQKPGLSSFTLTMWVKASHPNMPLMRLEADTIEDITAYLMTMRLPTAPQ
jgi:mono/diheme cytochrome c family protein